MDAIKVFLEAGEKKVFAGATEWPGWCRSGRDEEAALQALVECGPRYAQVLSKSDVYFQPPSSTRELAVVERVAGSSTTDFGAPAASISADEQQVDTEALEFYERILAACWQAFDAALRQARGKELRKGPRGGGRDLEKIINHVIDGDRGYLSRLAYQYKREDGVALDEELERIRAAILDALEIGVVQGLPEHGPRGGTIWSIRFFVRRTSWHVLDHAWEIEDRIA